MYSTRCLANVLAGVTYGVAYLILILHQIIHHIIHILSSQSWNSQSAWFLRQHLWILTVKSLASSLAAAWAWPRPFQRGPLKASTNPVLVDFMNWASACRLPLMKWIYQSFAIERGSLLRPYPVADIFRNRLPESDGPDLDINGLALLAFALKYQMACPSPGW